MDLLKSAGILALKEPTDVLTRRGNHGDMLIPDMFIRNNPLVVDNFDTAYDLFVAHPSNNSLSSRTRTFLMKFVMVLLFLNLLVLIYMMNTIFLNMVILESGILLVLYYNFNVLMMWYF
jgi:hypothetical protein